MIDNISLVLNFGENKNFSGDKLEVKKYSACLRQTFGIASSFIGHKIFSERGSQNITDLLPLAGGTLRVYFSVSNSKFFTSAH